MAEWESAGEYSGGGESGQAQDRTYTATAGGETKVFQTYNEAARWAQDHRDSDHVTEVRTT